ncbi:MAG: 3-deoxy-manno-octulosonate cytidylyltransferase [Phycisphaerales bacterium]
MMSGLIVIPARYESSRFPGKMLASETGRTLLQHTWERAMASGAGDVLVATDHAEIAAVARGFGASVRMTRADHPNGTSRIAEVVADMDELPPDAPVVNVQGDEPELDPGLIEAAVGALLSRPDCMVSTLAAPLDAGDDADDSNIVKVVTDLDGRALYFSRSRVPFSRRDGRAGEATDGAADGPAPPLRHIGLYVYRRSFLARYAEMQPTPLEVAERLEQLRVLEHGHRIAVATVATGRHRSGIDTPEQYAAFVARWNAGSDDGAGDGAGNGNGG